ncbi:MAG: hypothetical protein HYV09_32375 [Deltaproteobacteria bacterium]|nr:hypothetical protein [Deltaproteobacteria bacterium]
MRRLGVLVAVFVVAGCHRDLDVCPDDSCLELDSAPLDEASTGDAEMETGTPPGDSSAFEDVADTAADSGAEELDADAADTLADSDSGAVVDSAVIDSTVTDTWVADTVVVDTGVADTFVPDTFSADTFVPDTYVADTFVADTYVADTYVADTYVAPPSCTDAGPASEPCGKCGTRTRTCVAPGTWGAWGACTGEGVCTPGEVASVSTACGGALEKKTKTCTTSCTWGADVCALPKGWTAIADSTIDGRVDNSTVWTGGEMIVYGGGITEAGPSKSDGAIFSVYKNAWTTLPANTSPTAARRAHAAAWTGSDMIIWGGREGSTVRSDGFIYYATAKTWSALPTAAPISGRRAAASIWIPTVRKLFIWGGDNLSTKLSDGALLDPSGYSWSLLPSAPLSARSDAVAYWSGKEVIVWGGSLPAGGVAMDGAAYDPAANSWRLLPAASSTGRFGPSTGLTTDVLVVFGGSDGADVAWNGMKMTLTSSPAWSPLAAPASSLLTKRANPQAWIDGNRLTLWSGFVESGDLDPNGATLDVTTGAWSALDISGAPISRTLATTLWSGKYALIWSGYGKPGGGIVELLQSGAIYVP